MKVQDDRLIKMQWPFWVTVGGLIAASLRFALYIEVAYFTMTMIIAIAVIITGILYQHYTKRGLQYRMALSRTIESDLLSKERTDAKNAFNAAVEEDASERA